jgi:predicted AAA+ superfamily ATPase
MFQRLIQHELDVWPEKPDRKPLVIRGARQVEKTTVTASFHLIHKLNNNFFCVQMLCTSQKKTHNVYTIEYE